jgi:hypothetical protein
VFLRDVFRQNGYNDRQINRVLNRRPNISKTEDNPDSVAFLLYVGTIFNRIRRVLSRHNIKSVGPTPKLEDHPLSAVRDCLFNIFTASLHNWRVSPPSAT